MRSRSLLEVPEAVLVRPGPALLRHASGPLDLVAHRAAYGPLPHLDADELSSLVAGVRLRGRGGAGFPFGRSTRPPGARARSDAPSSSSTPARASPRVPRMLRSRRSPPTSSSTGLR